MRNTLVACPAVDRLAVLRLPGFVLSEGTGSESRVLTPSSVVPFDAIIHLSRYIFAAVLDSTLCFYTKKVRIIFVLRYQRFSNRGPLPAMRV
jgi:hypothetical protein